MTNRTQIVNLAAVLCLAVGCVDPDVDTDDVEDRAEELGRPRALRVMTQNMYVGADVDPIMTAAPDELPFVVAEAYATLQSTDLTGRVATMAAQIRQHRPDLVALQEVSIIRVQDPGDIVLGGQTPAETVVYDFLPALLDALAAEGLRYEVVARVENTDAEAPMITPAFTFVDVRLTDLDVILARSDLPTRVVAERNYATSLPLPNGLTVKRGFLVVDATLRGRTVRFASTHLEDGLLDVQLAQAAELIAFLSSSPRPVVLAGDFNSRAPDGMSYRMLVDAGYRDVWTETPHREPGFTCCQDADLRNEVSSLDQRIDVIFTRDLRHAPGRARVIDDDLTDSGLWPSDHAGLVARIQPR